MYDEAAHERIAKMKAAGMFGAYGRAEFVGKALASGGEERAAEAEAVLARHEADDLATRWADDVPERIREDFDALVEVVETLEFAEDVVAGIRDRHTRALEADG